MGTSAEYGKRLREANANRKLAVAMRKQGATCGEIARRLKMSRERVCQFLRPHFDMRERHANEVRLRDAENAALFCRIGEGKTVQQLSDLLGIPPGTVRARRDALKARGVWIPKLRKGRPGHASRDKAI